MNRGVPDPSPLMRLESVHRVFGGLIVALEDVNLSVSAGELVAIVGPSGSGKTSLLNVMAGFDAPSSGRITWRGEPVAPAGWSSLRGKQIGVVFQDFLLLPTLTALENVEMAMMGRGIPAAERRTRSAALLEEVGLSSRTGHLPGALSGGERQRVAVARSIANRPPLLLADEPTGNLDSANSNAVIDLLLEMQRAHGMCLVLVTHDDALATRCPRRIRMKDGRIVEDLTKVAEAAAGGGR